MSAEPIPKLRRIGRVRRDYRFRVDIAAKLRDCAAKTGRTETAVIERAISAFLATKGAWR